MNTIYFINYSTHTVISILNLAAIIFRKMNIGVFLNAGLRTIYSKLGLGLGLGLVLGFGLTNMSTQKIVVAAPTTSTLHSGSTVPSTAIIGDNVRRQHHLQ